MTAAEHPQQQPGGQVVTPPQSIRLLTQSGLTLLEAEFDVLPASCVVCDQPDADLIHFGTSVHFTCLPKYLQKSLLNVKEISDHFARQEEAAADADPDQEAW